MDNGNQLNVETAKLGCAEGFRKLLKIGVYKELHKRGLLTDYQLSELISMQGRVPAFSPKTIDSNKE